MHSRFYFYFLFRNHGHDLLNALNHYRVAKVNKRFLEGRHYILQQMIICFLNQILYNNLLSFF